jgi:hypothetical protein
MNDYVADCLHLMYVMIPIGLPLLVALALVVGTFWQAIAGEIEYRRRIVQREK